MFENDWYICQSDLYNQERIVNLDNHDFWKSILLCDV